MKDSDWTKIIEVDGVQVLFYYDFDLEHMKYCFHQMVKGEDGRVSDLVIGGITHGAVQDLLEEASEGTARLVMIALKQLLEEQDIGIEEDHE